MASRRRRKTKQEIQAILESGPFKNIKSEQDLLDYLTKNENSYNNYMLDLIQRKKNGVLALNEKHHIIPTSEGGPNAEWNLVPVTYEEHKEAHQKRFEVFGKQGDLVAAYGRDSLPENFAAFRTLRAKEG